MKRVRCDAVMVQIVATEYDAVGRPVGETVCAPVKVFRGKVRDFWGEVDKAVADMVRQQAQPTPAPTVAAPKPSRRTVSQKGGS